MGLCSLVCEVEVGLEGEVSLEGDIWLLGWF